MGFLENLNFLKIFGIFGILKNFQEISGFGNVGQIHSGLMFKGFPTQTIQKSKMSQEEGEGGNEVYLGLP